MNTVQELLSIRAGSVSLEGCLSLPPNSKGLVLFAHGSGSSRHSPRNIYVADVLNREGMATLLMDLLSPTEDLSYEARFDIDLLAERLAAATNWVVHQSGLASMPIGYFGASTGAAAAIKAAALVGTAIRAVVSRGGRPDLAGSALTEITSPTLLIVGSQDYGVIELNQEAYSQLKGIKKLCLVPGATHLFEEPGTLHEAALLASNWFSNYLTNCLPPGETS